MRRLASLFLLAGLIVAAPVPPPARAFDPNEHFEEISLYLIGNITFTLYHEIGHAMVEVLQLPILGREEDAVDNLATILMIPEPGDVVGEELIIAAADGWLLSHYDAEDAGYEQAYWGEHGLDLQRYYNIMCLVYGSNPGSFGDLAEMAELPPDRMETCPEEYERVAASWDAVLKPHTVGPGRPASTIPVEYRKPAPEFQRFMGLFRESAIVDTIAARVGASYHFPKAPTIEVANCDEANAFYDPNSNMVTLCYELVAELERQILTDIAARYDEPPQSSGSWSGNGGSAQGSQPGSGGTVKILRKTE